MRRQATDCEKIFAKHTSGKGVLSKIKNSKNSTIKKLSTQLKNRPEQTPHQRRYTNGKKAYEKMFSNICH